MFFGVFLLTKLTGLFWISTNLDVVTQNVQLIFQDKSSSSWFRSGPAIKISCCGKFLYFFDRKLIIYFNVYFILLLQVNYVKAIDKYLIVCFLFVFCSLLEYAIVLLLDRGKRKFEKEKNEVRVLVTCYSHHLICYKFLTRKDWGRDFLSIPMLHCWDHKTGHRCRDKRP